MAQAIGDGRAQRLERALEALRERFGPWRVTVPKREYCTLRHP